jgi:hypothetical protein
LPFNFLNFRNWSWCLSGALFVEDFRRIIDELGFEDCRVISKTNITVNNADIEKKFYGIKFYSTCFKLDYLEDKC